MTSVVLQERKEVKLMHPYTYYNIMRKSKDKKFFRYQMVLYAEREGKKATAKFFKTTVKTVRKWCRRYKDYGYAGLDEISRRPHSSPNATPAEERKQLVMLKKKYKRLGADQIIVIEKLTRSPRTIRKIWKQEGVSSRKRRKKHVTKQNLREVKKQYPFLKQVMEDTKVLYDIPEYWPQMTSKRLYRVQYTARDVTSGMKYLGFADTQSLEYSTLFAKYLNYYLQLYGADLSQTIRQTDNGSEYIGHVTAKKPSAYTRAIAEVPGQVHLTIFPGAHRMQADVETVHNLIEAEFYELETFSSKRDFMNKVYSYQLFFNLQRPNTYKENKTPWQLAREKVPALPIGIAKIPPVDLCELAKKNLDFLDKGGYDVYSNPLIIQDF